MDRIVKNIAMQVYIHNKTYPGHVGSSLLVKGSPGYILMSN